MAETNDAASTLLASAVIVPEASGPSAQSSTGTIKRRASSDSASESKRPRLGEGAKSQGAASGDRVADTDVKTTGPPREVRRKSEAAGGKQEEEKKRGKRLFGALLGTISQSAPSRTQKRREDIEKRTQSRLKELDAEREDEQRRAADELRAARVREQRLWDAQSVRIASDNERATARFLKTKAQPTLYFRPWKLLEHQKERVEAQVEEAESGPRGEGEDTSRMAGEAYHHDESPGSNGQALSEQPKTADSTEAPEMKATDGPAHMTVTDPDKTVLASTQPEANKDVVEDNEEMVVDTGEDPVIY